jgi:hypothetical protein
MDHLDTLTGSGHRVCFYFCYVVPDFALNDRFHLLKRLNRNHAGRYGPDSFSAVIALVSAVETANPGAGHLSRKEDRAGVLQLVGSDACHDPPSLDCGIGV